MYICKNCGQTYTDPVRFCGKCGSNLIEAQMAAPQPEPIAYAEPAPAYSYAAPVAPAPSASKGPAIVGMIFGIIAAIFSLASVIVASSALDAADSYSYYYYYSSYYLSNLREEAFAVLAVMSIFIVPCIIVGLITSFKKSGLKALSIVGRITSFVGLALWLISFIMVASI